MRSFRSASRVLALMIATACSGVGQGNLDQRAEMIRDELGPLCSNFDFQSVQETAGGELRPVNCKRDERVTMRILVFQDQAHLDAAWRDVAEAENAVDPGPPGPIGLGLEDEATLLEVYDRSLLNDVEERLSNR